MKYVYSFKSRKNILKSGDAALNNSISKNFFSGNYFSPINFLRKINSKKGLLFFSALFLSFCMIFSSSTITNAYTKKVEIPPVIILSCTNKTLNIHDTFSLSAAAVPVQNKTIRFKSSSSRIASVSSKGLITAKKAGTCTITASVSHAEAHCTITVRETTIQIAKKSVSLEHGETFALQASSSNHSKITYKTNRSSIAVVSSKGVITACKPGEAIITAKADQTSVTCTVTVKKPIIKINERYVELFRCGTKKLSTTVSSGIKPVWSSSKKSVATVDQNGVITAIKHGNTIISAKVDGVAETCLVVVNSPTITLNSTSLTLGIGKTYSLKANVSSGNTPIYSSSNSSVATVDQSGKIIAKKAGRATIYVKEDGTTARCQVLIQDK